MGEGNVECLNCHTITTYSNRDLFPAKWECASCGHGYYHMEIEPSLEDKTFEAIEVKQKANLKHPLLNPDSPHYNMVDGVEAITRMEQMYTTEQLMAWAVISAMKYRLRIGNKDNPQKEVVKILGYEAYYTYLEQKLNAQ